MTEGFVSSRRFTFVAALLMAAFAFMLLTAGGSKAATQPFHIDFDTSDIQLGTIGDLPIEDLGTKASIDGTVDDNGVVKIKDGGFKFPELGITDPVDVKGFMSLDGPATGTYDATTGALEIDGTGGIYVSLDVAGLMDTLEASGIDIGSMLGGAGSIGGFDISTIIGLVPNLTCGFTEMDLHFTTGTTAPTGVGTGEPFVNGTDGAGAISTEWSQLGIFGGKTKVLGFVPVCGLLKDALPGLLDGLTTGTTLPIDLGDLNLASLLDNLDAVDLGPSGLTLTRTTDTSIPDPDPVPDPAALKLNVNPKKSVVKRGKKINYLVKVSNTGDVAASGVKLCVKLPKKALAGKPCTSVGSVPAASTRTRKVRVKVKANATKKSYKVKFTADASEIKPVRTTVSIRAR